MDYSKLQPQFKDQKLIFDNEKVWYPTESTKNGYNIGDTVFHVNKKHQFLTELKIVVERIFTEYDLTQPCEMFGRHRVYKTSVERVIAKPIEGTWNNGDRYKAYWFSGTMEFPFDFIMPNSEKLQEFRKKLYSSTFKEADVLWADFDNFIKI